LPTPSKRGRKREGRRGEGERPGLPQQCREPLLVGEEGVVAEIGVELPEVGGRAHGLKLAMELVLERPGKEQVARHSHDVDVGANPLELFAQGLLAVGEGTAIDRLAEHQEGVDRESSGEPLAMMIEVASDLRALVAGRQPAEPRVELVAAAVGEHAELTSTRHPGVDVAVADAVAHELALQMPGRGAPAIRS
jgi:hypothetical protein